MAVWQMSACLELGWPREAPGLAHSPLSSAHGEQTGILESAEPGVPLDEAVRESTYALDAGGAAAGADSAGRDRAQTAPFFDSEYVGRRQESRYTHARHPARLQRQPGPLIRGLLSPRY